LTESIFSPDRARLFTRQGGAFRNTVDSASQEWNEYEDAILRNRQQFAISRRKSGVSFLAYLNSHHRTTNTLREAMSGTKKCTQTVCSTFCKTRQEIAIVKEIFTQNYWNAENILAVWNRIKNIFRQYFTKLYNFFRMA
jgi:hypothetical protein